MQGYLDANRYNEASFPNSRYTFGEMRVEADGGMLQLHGDGSITIKKLGEAVQEYDYSPSKDNFAGDCVFETLCHFIECLNSGIQFETSGLEYIKNIYVQESIYKSADLNQAIEVAYAK